MLFTRSLITENKVIISMLLSTSIHPLKAGAVYRAVVLWVLFFPAISSDMAASILSLQTGCMLTDGDSFFSRMRIAKQNIRGHSSFDLFFGPFHFRKAFEHQLGQTWTAERHFDGIRSSLSSWLRMRICFDGHVPFVSALQKFLTM